MGWGPCFYLYHWNSTIGPKWGPSWSSLVHSEAGRSNISCRIGPGEVSIMVHMESCSIKYVSSCVDWGGHSWQMFSHKDDTWRVCCPCVSWDVSSVHPSGQTSSHSRARSRSRASPLCGFSCGPSGGKTSCTPEIWKWLGYIRQNIYTNQERPIA